MEGRTLSHYRIEEEIGRGGMGVVYRALDTRLNREVALKVLSPALTSDEGQRLRLLQEARTAAALNHPGVAVVHEIDEADGITFIAMELVRGQPLSRLLETGPLRAEAALDLGLQVAEALSAGHAQGIVHRDLKPGNVVLNEDGRAKLIDFGLAKTPPPRRSVDSGDDTPPRGNDAPGRLVGTAAYMSPEQVRGDEVDARSDVFSFGALLQEMLTARPPFRRGSAIETLHAVLNDAAPRLAGSDLGSVEAEVQRILDKCLAKRAEDRYPGALDLLVDLRTARRRLPPPGPAPEARPSLGVVIVDDEEPAREVLEEYLAQVPGFHMAAQCRNGFEAVKAVTELKPDLVLLDVQMPKLDGFEVLELIGRDVAVVFVTAYDQHALRAFEVNAVDYLLKPVSPERFVAALERVRQRLGAGIPAPPVAPLLQEVRPRGRAADRILVRQGSKVHVIATDDVDYVQAQDDYVALHYRGKEHLKQQTLADLEGCLDPARFVRIHRSYLLNLDRLAGIESDGKDGRVAVLADGTRLPLSRSGHARLKELL